nr:unnamed protein product [Callosobruchus chinensis]
MKKGYPFAVEGDWKKIEAELLRSHVGPKIIDNYFLFAHRGKIKFFVYLVIFSFVLNRSSLIQSSRECILDMPPVASKAFREPENCEFCKNIKDVDRVTNISPDEFLEFYSKPGRPVVVTDGAINWPAMQTFDFNFFKQLHQEVEFDRSEVKNCQFFPYKTEFKHLGEVFNMSTSRANLDPQEAPWYVGWSNCNDNAGKVLQQYYSKPYFLGNNSENIALSWIFMGGPGYGAQMHVCILSIHPKL